jgi:hypothetical protein
LQLDKGGNSRYALQHFGRIQITERMFRWAGEQ